MRSTLNWFSAGIVIAASGLIVIGCKDKSAENAGATSSAAAPTTQIAVIAKSTVNSYWTSVNIGAEKAAKEFNVSIIWTGPDSETNHSQQANMVDDMANKGVSGIVLAPTNVDALVRPVESAVAKGIPVVLIDSTLNSDKPSSVIATDNYAAGKQAAEALIAAMPKDHKHGGKILMLRYLEGSGSTEAREKGFVDRISSEPGLTLSSQMYTKGGGSTTDAADTADALLRGAISNNILAVDGIFAANQPTAMGMLAKLDEFKAQGVTIDALYVGFDADKDVLLPAVRDGRIAALVVQDPAMMGYLGVKTMVQLLGGQKVDAKIPTATVTVTKQNIDTPEIKAVTGG